MGGEFVLAVGIEFQCLSELVRPFLLQEVTPGVPAAEMQLSKYLYINVFFKHLRLDTLRSVAHQHSFSCPMCQDVTQLLSRRN